MRVDPSVFARLSLHAHDFLADVSVHDVWAARLRGAPPETRLDEVFDCATEADGSMDPLSRGLFALRAGIGRLFGWDRTDPRDGARSYVHRLSAEQRDRSIHPPGSKRGFWTVVYAHEREAIGEVINDTVHAFLVFALEPAVDGLVLYLAVYVKPVGRWTPLYMALIDPFRRFVIYPQLVRRVEDAWSRCAGVPS